jgi:hypothetical protein
MVQTMAKRIGGEGMCLDIGSAVIWHRKILTTVKNFFLA